MNTNTFDKLQYNDLKKIVKSYCVSGLGKKLIDKLKPSTNLKVIDKRLNETSEGRALLDTCSYIPLEGIFNIDNIIDNVEKGMVLEPENLTTLCNFLRGCRKIKNFMKDKEFYAPTLSSYGNSITEFTFIEEEIELSIRGSLVDSNASKELRKIRRLIENTESKIQDKLEKFLKNSSNKKYIQEFFISKRNGRYTIPIKAAYKNQVPGNIVETSSKGSTIFIEPNNISKSTEELTALKAEESIEEYKILSTLTALVFDNLREIKINMEVIEEYDMIFAKAKYSKAINGMKPKINDYGYINIIKGKHPLLKGDVVPLDFKVGDDYRTLIITGPNAGGKTVVLKTVGILTLAVQSGFHISAAEGTEISVFEKIFVDIGDDQSIENALSTFSSHIKNLADIIDNSNKSTLILCDEIGSGTEPNEGAGLAIAILEEFYHKGCITVATTHYGEIKNFSEIHEDFQNAAMQFESETLEPLYKLVIGKSGESNALWISKKMGIKNSVLEKAESYIKNKDYNFKLVKESKIKNRKVEEEFDEHKNYYYFKIGDRVFLMDYEDFAIVYKEKDRFNNVTVLYKENFIEVNEKRIRLELKAEDLYPKDYDLNTLFVSYKDRKLERDIIRGSKKALKKIQKEIKNQYHKE
ncbi:endonuclease MutS2 [Clostridium autoethanogenum]|uniref:Endonuclease MutS2 n=1 Tax=Clostridium autoethanogenum DSM 10061 TaxID=1341692 RepID=A0ABM5NYQ9_9CLOT|nr:DNA mismatch repair protein MutS [Clostridium autoethanogenum]AGY77810.1 endonuclease MutS2 [Clostridium autoethanogenum DSM 10061]ALU37944.1 DNA mismatch repair protein MutS family [Clostridium autoethanogenum DSM 10061]OVY50708.1 Endonuclease MutS2 [Clostridium autoethanogenum]